MKRYVTLSIASKNHNFVVKTCSIFAMPKNFFLKDFRQVPTYQALLLVLYHVLDEIGRVGLRNVP